MRALVWILLITSSIVGSDELFGGNLKIARLSFDAWRHQYGRDYVTTDEYNKRFLIFADNLEYIYRTNQRGLSYKLDVNEYSDLTFGEFTKAFLITTPQNCSATRNGHQFSSIQLPTAIDWRTKGVVTPVKNQGQCGSCWTFSTTGCLESHHAIKTGKLVSLSEQQLVDCAQAFNNHGCDGGLPSQAFEYIKYNKGLESEADYPYKAHDEKCHFDPSKVVATVSGVMNITMDAEDEIVDAVGTKGPVSIAFEVVRDFQHYSGGVYSSNECKKTPQDVNHAVLAVGYNVTEKAEKYWIVKNSWGASWGLKGYFWIARGQNMCGLATCASYPLV